MAYRPAFLDLSPRLRDVQAGLTVAIVALPLSMAIAIASGLGPDRGLVTAIVGGFLVSALGGTRHQIGGPAGAFIILVSACVMDIGVPGLILATMLSGVLLAALGLARIGGLIRFVPYPVIVGFSAGIGIIILASQMHDMLGLTLPGAEPGPLLEKLPALAAAQPSTRPESLAIAALTIAAILGCQRFVPRLPSLLIGVAVALLAGQVLPAETVADRFGALPAGLPLPVLPDITWAALEGALPYAGSFALLGAIESLLSGTVADQMAGTRMRPDDELIGQGLANLGVGLFGGFCTTGTIARTATNVRAGSAGPLSGMIHSGLLLVFLILAAPLAGAIPLAGLAGLLAIIAWNMIEWHAMAALARIDRAEALAMAVTLAVTLLRDLTEGIIVGTALAGIGFIARMSATARATLGAAPAPGVAPVADPDTMTCRLSGPVFFGAVVRIERLLDQIVARPRLVMIDMREVPFIDTTGARMIADFAARQTRRGTEVIVIGAIAPVRRALRGIRHAPDPETAARRLGLASPAPAP